MNKNKLRIAACAVLWCAVVCMMCVMFCFSGQNAEQSSGVSDSVTTHIAEIIVPDYENKTPEEKTAVLRELSTIVRKGAHATEYMLLAALVSCAMFAHRKKLYVRAVTASYICLLFAVTDEFHQLFVEGRSGEVRDVLIDFIGSTIGIIAANIIGVLILKAVSCGRKRKHNENLLHGTTEL